MFILFVCPTGLRFYNIDTVHAIVRLSKARKDSEKKKTDFPQQLEKTASTNAVGPKPLVVFK